MEVACDKQGRFLIPPQLRAFASIERDAVIIGVSDRIEVWAKEKWDDFVSSDAMDLDALTETLNDDGFDL